jgi:glycosidase
VNVAKQDGRADSLLQWYRDLVAARTALPSLSADAETVIIDVPETEVIVVIRRDAGDRGVVVVLNFSHEASADVVVDTPSSPLPRGNRTLVPVVGSASLAEITVRRDGAAFGSLGVIAAGGAVIYRVE